MPAALPPERFGREMGCTEAEFLQWLPAAVGSGVLVLEPPAAARVTLAGGGAVHLRWESLPPRAIALLRIPRLHVDFRFEGMDAAARAAFMRRFDLYTRRGGG